MLKSLAIYLGAAAIILGIAFTVFPLGTETGQGCGNAWSNGDDVGALDSAAVEDACGAVRADRWILVSSFVVLGAASLLAGVDGPRREGVPAPPQEPGQAS